MYVHARTHGIYIFTVYKQSPVTELSLRKKSFCSLHYIVNIYILSETVAYGNTLSGLSRQHLFVALLKEKRIEFSYLLADYDVHLEKEQAFTLIPLLFLAELLDCGSAIKRQGSSFPGSAAVHIKISVKKRHGKNLMVYSSWTHLAHKQIGLWSHWNHASMNPDI